jgi:hypothetical protein
VKLFRSTRRYIKPGDYVLLPQHKLPKLIIIDQFEEIFSANRRDADVFVKVFVDTVADHNETVGS